MGCNVILIDDHKLVLDGYTQLLESRDYFKIIGTASNVKDGYKKTLEASPDLVILDIMMPGDCPISYIHRFKAHCKNTCIIVVSAHAHISVAKRCFNEGANGFVTKASGGNTLIKGINKAIAGDLYISPDLADEFAQQYFGGKPSNPFDILSPREFDIFMRIAKGESIIEISENIFLSPKTVSNYASKIKNKLDISTTAKFVHLALKEGILPYTR